MVIFINGRYVEEEKAVLHVSDLSIQRGYGIFDFFRISNFVPVFLNDYLDRFYRSAEGLRLNVPHQPAELREIIQEMIKRNAVADAGFRLLLTGGCSGDSYTPSQPNFIVIEQPLTMPTKEKINHGLAIITHEYGRELPHIKSINYLVGIYLQQQLESAAADEVLYVKNNNVLEFPRSNVFIVTPDDVVVTPANGVLHGITRRKVLDVAAKNYLVQERVITTGELKNAREIFLTSTTKRILPVTRLNGTSVGDGKPGAVTLQLLHDFVAAELEYCRQHQ